MPPDLLWLQVATYAATIAAALTGAVSAVFIARQLKIMKKGREVDTFLAVLEHGNRDLVRTAANWLKHDMPHDLAYEDAIRPGPRDQIAIIVHHFEMIGVLVQHRYINADLVYDQMGPWIVGSWAKLRPFVGSHRIKREAPDYAENFEMLVAGYDEWSRKNPAKLELRQRASHSALLDYYKHPTKPVRQKDDPTRLWTPP